MGSRRTMMGTIFRKQWGKTFLLPVAKGIVLLAIAGCTNQTTTSPTEVSPSPQPVTNSTVKQTQSAPTTENFRQVTVLQGLEHPWGIAWLPDGTMLITERPGRLRVVRNGKLEPTPVTGVPEVFAVNQGGLLDVSVHPNFAENRLIYLTYAHGTEQANRTRVARARFDGKALQDVRVIFEVNRTKSGGQHFGSRILWLPDRTMLISIGDGGNPPVRLDGDLIRKQAQNLQSHLGKIVRLNDDGTIPKDNPFVGNNNANSAIWSYGHRNIQGIAFDPINNQVWVNEHGARGGDELNLVQAGKNYGWPVVSYSREYSTGEPVSAQKSQPGMVDPKTVWTPATAPSGLAFYNGDRFPQWQGNLFSGGLVSRDVRRITLDKAGNVLSQESIAISQRVRDVRQGPDGLLYILTDEQDGQLIRLEPVAQKPKE
ncbi:PQQ-dependent sugar dehydrogenase [Aerosakkonemataceae cyanobacterium BLCC-F154]|uniref:PQQ-dependent sugar dehydrogenase n=1 Tax=Floridaenema fluviatile BLCC-F154 TaxID=3153640 RepID=A0ABV4YFL0_9CYAN